jgi:hypothetical protein
LWLVAPDGPLKYKYLVRELSDLNRVKIPLFHGYPLRTIKQLDSRNLQLWRLRLEESEGGGKEHLTEQGLANIRQIKGFNEPRQKI